MQQRENNSYEKFLASYLRDFSSLKILELLPLGPSSADHTILNLISSKLWHGYSFDNTFGDIHYPLEEALYRTNPEVKEFFHHFLVLELCKLILSMLY